MPKCNEGRRRLILEPVVDLGTIHILRQKNDWMAWVGGSRKASFADVQYCTYADIVGELVKKVKNYADVIHQHGWYLTQT
jgi:hypothetical protein